MQTTRLTIDQFPYLLKEIHNPPKFLDCAGALPPSKDYRYLCVIGSRHPSQYGADACKTLIRGLRDYPVVIVSGLAIGIDSIAHIAALENKMKTIAFPGSGLNRSVIYPYSHIGLAERIVNTGNTLLSSFIPSQIGAYWTFPARNRLMAGSSHATLIIEGREGSGTLLTANYALEFGRDVMIVPGSIFSDLSYGPHKLHTEGATPVTNSKEVLEVLGFEVGDTEPFCPIVDVKRNIKQDNNVILCKIPDRSKIGGGVRYIPKPKPASQSLHFQIPTQIAIRTPSQIVTQTPNLSSLSKEELLVIRALQFSSLSGSDLVQKTGLKASEVNIVLSELELKGQVRQDRGVYVIMPTASGI